MSAATRRAGRATGGYWPTPGTAAGGAAAGRAVPLVDACRAGELVREVTLPAPFGQARARDIRGVARMVAVPSPSPLPRPPPKGARGFSASRICSSNQSRAAGSTKAWLAPDTPRSAGPPDPRRRRTPARCGRGRRAGSARGPRRLRGSVRIAWASGVGAGAERSARDRPSARPRSETLPVASRMQLARVAQLGGVAGADRGRRRRAVVVLDRPRVGEHQRIAAGARGEHQRARRRRSCRSRPRGRDRAWRRRTRAARRRCRARWRGSRSWCRSLSPTPRRSKRNTGWPAAATSAASRAWPANAPGADLVAAGDEQQAGGAGRVVEGARQRFAVAGEGDKMPGARPFKKSRGFFYFFPPLETPNSARHELASASGADDVAASAFGLLGGCGRARPAATGRARRGPIARWSASAAPAERFRQPPARAAARARTGSRPARAPRAVPARAGLRGVSSMPGFLAGDDPARSRARRQRRAGLLERSAARRDFRERRARRPGSSGRAWRRNVRRRAAAASRQPASVCASSGAQALVAAGQVGQECCRSPRRRGGASSPP